MDLLERIKIELLPATDARVEELRKEMDVILADGFPSDSYEEFNKLKEEGDLMISVLETKGLLIDEEGLRGGISVLMNERASRWTEGERVLLMKFRTIERKISEIEALQHRLEKQLFVN